MYTLYIIFAAEKHDRTINKIISMVGIDCGNWGDGVGGAMGKR